MINLSPNDKKLLALLLLVFVIIFSVIMIDFFLNTKILLQSASQFEVPDEWEQKIAEILEGPKNTRPAMIRKSLNKIFDLMNEGDYERLFKLVSPDFKKEMFNDDLDNFSEFMKSYGDEEYSPYFTEYKRFDNTYMVLVSFVPYSNTDEDIIETKKPKKTDTFFIKYSDTGTFTFSCLRYVGEKELGTGVQNSQFRVILNKTVLYKTKSEFYFTITNNTDTPITIDYNDVYCYTGVKPRFYPMPITVKPNSSEDFTFSVGTGLSIASAVPNEIYFRDVVVNGNEYSFHIDTDFCVDI